MGAAQFPEGQCRFPNRTIAHSMYILRTAGSVMCLKEEKNSRFLCNYSRCDTISCAANGTETVCCDCRCTGTETAELSVQ